MYKPNISSETYSLIEEYLKKDWCGYSISDVEIDTIDCQYAIDYHIETHPTIKLGDLFINDNVCSEAIRIEDNEIKSLSCTC